VQMVNPPCLVPTTIAALLANRSSHVVAALVIEKYNLHQL